MHGSSGGTVVINISPMSEKEAENERLKEIARHSEKMTAPKSKSCPSDMEIVRDSDVILYDHMDFGGESPLFSVERAPDFASAMGASDDEIDQIRSIINQEKMKMGSEPAALSSFKRDYGDFRKFGGDTVAMELDRDVDRESSDMSDMSDIDMDELLGFSMGSSPAMEMGDVMGQAEAAMKEQFGRDAMAVMEGEADGVVSFSVDSPEMGRVRYQYDSRTGEGRVMRGE